MVRASVEAEKLGIPSVSVMAPMFMRQAQIVARGFGLPGLNLALYPGPIDNHSPQEVERNVAAMFDTMVAAWLAPVASDAARVVEPAAPDPADAVFTGTFSQVNDRFYDAKWSDGLTIVPPTRAAVEAMLRDVDRDWHAPIAVLPMANLTATPWNVAVNAVMAGCRPEYMPVLIAAVEVFGDPVYQLKDLGTTASLKPFIVINGPIVKALDINCGTSLMALGRRSNATIGRALGLITRNIAGFREGESWMGCFGWPGSPWVMAEDEDNTPWEPYHVERGFPAGTSTVTGMMMMNMTYQMMTAGDTPEPHLTGLCYNMGKAFGTTFLQLGQDHGSMNVFISPANAKVLARGGYSKEDVRRHIAQHSTLTVREIDEEFRFTFTVPNSIHRMAERGAIPSSWDRPPDERIPIIPNPAMIHIVVCGSAERNRNLIMRASYCRPVTRPVRSRGAASPADAASSAS